LKLLHYFELNNDLSKYVYSVVLKLIKFVDYLDTSSTLKKGISYNICSIKVAYGSSLLFFNIDL